MSSTVQLKRSALSGKVPGTGSLNLGELALNTYDGKIFFRRSGSTDTIQEVVTTNVLNTGSVTITGTLTAESIIGSISASNGIVSGSSQITLSSGIGYSTLATTGSNQFTSDQNITGSLRATGTGSFGSLKVNDTLTINHGETIMSGSALVTNDLTILGQVNARQFNIAIISSSVLFESGSSRFGNTLDDTHDFTGSVNVTGSLYLNGIAVATGSSVGNAGVFDFNLDPAAGTIGFITDSGSNYIVNATSTSVNIIGGETPFVIITSQSFSTNTTFTASLQQGYTLVGNSSGISYAVATSSIAGALPTGVISGSSQLTSSVLATTGSNSFIGNQSISGTIYLTGSIIPSGSFVYDLGSETNSFKDLFISTGSIKFVEGNTVVKSLSAVTLTALEAATGSLNISITNLNTTTASLNTSVSSLNTATASYETKGRGVVSGSSQVDVMSATNITRLATTGSNTFVGTQTMSGSLAVSGFGTSTFSSAGTGYNKLTIRNTTAGAANGAQLSIGTNADADQLYIQSFATTFTTSGMNIAGGAVVNGEGPGGLSIAATQSNIGFYTNGAAAANLRMFISSSGVVTTTNNISMTGTNAQLLQTTANSVAGDNVAVFYNSNANSYGMYIGAGSGTNHALFCTDSTRTANLFKVQGNGNVGIGIDPLAKLFVNIAGGQNIRFSQEGGHASISAVNDAANTFAMLNIDGNVVRIQSNSGGNVSIGTATDFGYKLNLNGQPGANGYTAWTNWSDSRLKENVTDLVVTNVLDKICAIRPVTYNYNELSGFDEATRARRISGFIAQELMEVFPDMVGTIKRDDIDYYDTNLSNLSLYLVKAIQELKAENDTLKERLTAGGL